MLQHSVESRHMECGGTYRIKDYRITAIYVGYGYRYILHAGDAYTGTEAYPTEEGFFMILSGGVPGQRDFAGVGFLIAPYARQYIIGFSEHTDRITNICYRVTGGQLGIMTAYAPHGGHEYSIRQSFYSELTDYYERFRCFGPKLIMGDMNARMHCQQEGESEQLVFFCTGNP